MGKVIRNFCWHQNFVPKGLSVPALGLYTCIKSFKMCLKSYFKEIVLKLATNGQSDKGFLLTSTFVPKGLSAPALGLYTCIKALKYLPGPGVRWAFTGPLVLWFVVYSVAFDKSGYFIKVHAYFLYSQQQVRMPDRERLRLCLRVSRMFQTDITEHDTDGRQSILWTIWWPAVENTECTTTYCCCRLYGRQSILWTIWWPAVENTECTTTYCCCRLSL